MTGLARRFRTSRVTLGLFRVLTRRPLRSTISLIRDQNNQNPGVLMILHSCRILFGITAYLVLSVETPLES